MKKNSLNISIIFFSISIIAFVIGYSWYFVIINVFPSFIIFGNTTSQAVYNTGQGSEVNYYSFIPWYIISSILITIGLILLIIYIYLSKKAKYNDENNRKKLKKTLMPIPIGFFSLAIAISLVGLVQFIINSSRFYVDNPYGIPVNSAFTYRIVIFNFISFISTIIGLILILIHTFKSKETDKRESKLPDLMKRNILYISIIFLFASLAVFYVATLLYLVKSSSGRNFQKIGSQLYIYVLYYYFNSIWWDIVSSGLTLIGLIFVVIYIFILKKAKYNDENNRKKLKNTLLYISIAFFVSSISVFLYSLIPAINYFYTNYYPEYYANPIFMLNGALFSILYFSSTVLTIIGLLLVISYINKSKKINMGRVILSKSS